MKRAQLVDYLNSHYKAPRMVLCAAGGVDHQHLTDLAEKYFGNQSTKYPGEIPPPKAAGVRFTGSEVGILC